MEKDCLNCETKFTPKNPKGKFCSDKCKVAYSRKNKSAKSSISKPAVEKEKPKVQVKDLNEQSNVVKPITDLQPKTNYAVNTLPKKDSLRSVLQSAGLLTTEKKKFIPGQKFVPRGKV